MGSIEYAFTQSRQTEKDIITFGLQTVALSAQIFRLESDLESFFLEYEIVRRMIFENIRLKILRF